MIHGLVYYVTPTDNWKFSYELLRVNISKINGPKICALAQGARLASYSTLHNEMVIFDEVILIENDPIARESKALLPLLTAIMDSNCDNFLFAHTKGVTRKDDMAVKLWTEGCYHHSFSKIDLMERHFSEGLHCTGVFKRYGRFAHFPPGSDWHYSGTFYWINRNKWASTSWRSAIKNHRYGAEAYPSLVVPSQFAGCLYADGVSNLYDLQYCRAVIEREDVSFSGHLSQQRKVINRR